MDTWFANSPTALKTFINSNLSRKTLTHNVYYQNYTENISSKCNYLFYSNPSLNNWTSDLYKNFQEWVSVEDWSNINAFAYQLTTNNELFYNVQFYITNQIYVTKAYIMER